MKKMVKTVILVLMATLAFSGAAAGSTEVLNNTKWSNIDNDNMAVTQISGNPYAGEEGAILTSACVSKNNNESYMVISYTIGDSGTVPSSVRNALNAMTSSSGRALDNRRYGLNFKFDDGSEYTFQLKKATEQFKGAVTVSNVTAAVDPQVMEKVKMGSWVDVRLVSDGQIITALKPFNLNGSRAAIEKINSCYKDF